MCFRVKHESKQLDIQRRPPAWGHKMASAGVLAVDWRFSKTGT